MQMVITPSRYNDRSAGGAGAPLGPSPQAPSSGSRSTDGRQGALRNFACWASSSFII